MPTKKLHLDSYQPSAAADIDGNVDAAVVDVDGGIVDDAVAGVADNDDAGVVVAAAEDGVEAQLVAAFGVAVLRVCLDPPKFDVRVLQQFEPAALEVAVEVVEVVSSSDVAKVAAVAGAGDAAEESDRVT